LIWYYLQKMVFLILKKIMFVIEQMNNLWGWSKYKFNRKKPPSIWWFSNSMFFHTAKKSGACRKSREVSIPRSPSRLFWLPLTDPPPTWKKRYKRLPVYWLGKTREGRENSFPYTRFFYKQHLISNARLKKKEILSKC